MRAFVAILALSVALVGCDSKQTRPTAQTSGISADQRGVQSGLQTLLNEAVSKGIPGISVAVATHEGLVFEGVAGKANLQTGTPVRSDMLFGIGSITKTFVAVVILQLAEEGRLDLKTTAASLLGAAVKGIPNANKATIAQLLNHTGGVPNWEDDPVWIRDGRGTNLNVARIWGKQDTLNYIKGHTPLAAPGEKCSYANTNYTLLGMIVEKVTGEEAVNEIHRRILVPLGLKDTYLEGFEPVQQNRLLLRVKHCEQRANILRTIIASIEKPPKIPKPERAARFYLDVERRDAASLLGPSDPCVRQRHRLFTCESSN